MAKEEENDDPVENEDEYIQFASRGERFFLEDPYIYLINPDLLPQRVSTIKGFNLKEILPSFYQKLLEEGQIDFRILGQSIYSAARIHRNKVTLAIEYEKKQEEKIAIKSKRREFQFEIPLPVYQTRTVLTLAESADPDSFYAELLLGLQEEDEKRKLDAIKEEKRKLGGTTDAKKRRRKLEAADFESFDYDIDFDRVAIEDIVNHTYDVITEIAEKNENNEAEFSKVVTRVSELTEKKDKISDEKRRINKARVLLSLLYLFRDEKISAEQELEEPFEIYIQVTTPGKTATTEDE